jgi:hypothetical protein
VEALTIRSIREGEKYQQSPLWRRATYEIVKDAQDAQRGTSGDTTRDRPALTVSIDDIHAPGDAGLTQYFTPGSAAQFAVPNSRDAF